MSCEQRWDFADSGVPPLQSSGRDTAGPRVENTVRGSIFRGRGHSGQGHPNHPKLRMSAIVARGRATGPVFGPLEEREYFR